MRLAVFLQPTGAVELAQEAERLGCAMALAPEGFRADAASVLGAVAASTSTIGLGTGVMQIPGRSPVLTALTAATIDGLSGGRFHLGLGVSNADVSRGWYGVNFDRPLERTREYVQIVRAALSGGPVRHNGKHYQLPPAGCTEAAHLRAASTRADLPIFLAGVGPRSLRQAGEIADGWIGVFCSPERLTESLREVATGRALVGKDLTGFEVLPSVAIGVGDDPEQAARPLRDYFANFIGMGDRDRSTYFKLTGKLGFGREAAIINDLCHAGDRPGAARAVPMELMDQVALIGDERRIAPRLAAYARAGVTTLGLTLLAPTVEGQIEALRVAVRALELAKQPA
jgi:F420-dependent oxidoreductase-like protein